MNEQEFAAACTQAIKEFHDPAVDGPLLICLRPNINRSQLHPGQWFTYPEYAAAIGEWPAQHHGSDYAQFTDSPLESIADLVKHAKFLWQERQPQDEPTEPAFLYYTPTDFVAGR